MVIVSLFFVFNVPSPTETNPYGPSLSLHDALPIFAASSAAMNTARAPAFAELAARARSAISHGRNPTGAPASVSGLSALEIRWRSMKLTAPPGRSEEHTSELQSLMRNSYAVFCLNKKHTEKAKTI